MVQSELQAGGRDSRYLLCMSTDTATTDQAGTQPELDWTRRRLLAIFWGVYFPWIMTGLWVALAELAGFAHDVLVIGTFASLLVSGAVGAYRSGWYMGLWVINISSARR